MGRYNPPFLNQIKPQSVTGSFLPQTELGSGTRPARSLVETGWIGSLFWSRQALCVYATDLGSNEARWEWKADLEEVPRAQVLHTERDSDLIFTFFRAASRLICVYWVTIMLRNRKDKLFCSFEYKVILWNPNSNRSVTSYFWLQILHE